MTGQASPESTVIGAVLAGGASQRMGQPKAVLRLDGVTLLQRAANALREGGAQRVLMVGGDPAWARGAGLVHLHDRWPGQGPLGGIATAVSGGPAAVEEDSPESVIGAPIIVVVVACDQPLLTAAALRSLVQALGNPASTGVGIARMLPKVAAACGADGRLQPFPSAWPAQLGPALVDAFEAGQRRADAGFALGDVVAVPIDDALLVDVDTPADLGFLTRKDPHRL